MQSKTKSYTSETVLFATPQRSLRNEYRQAQAHISGCFKTEPKLGFQRREPQAKAEPNQEQSQLLKRRFSRLSPSFRVRSHQLPGFQADVVDFSPLGLKIAVVGSLKRDLVVSLLVDFDWPDLKSATIQLQARVVWCQHHQGRCQAGLEFVNMEEHTGALLHAYYQAILSGPRSEDPAADFSLAKKVRVQGTLEGYSVEGDRLDITLFNANSRDIWRFSNLRFLRDRRYCSGLEVSSGWEIPRSPELNAANLNRDKALKPARPLKHLQLVNRDNMVILELIAELSECYRERGTENGSSK